MERPAQRILLVEDDIALRRLYRTALLLEGFAVAEAGDGVSALRLIEHQTPDLIVLDIGLPTLSGVSVQQELAAHAETCSVPVVIVTGAPGSDHSLARCVLRKPVEPERLVAEVRACLRTGSTASDVNALDREQHVKRVLDRAARQKRRALSTGARGRKPDGD